MKTIEEIVTEEAKQIILLSTRTLRDVAGALHMCLMLNKDGDLPVRELCNKLKEVGGRKGGTSPGHFAWFHNPFKDPSAILGPRGERLILLSSHLLPCTVRYMEDQG